MKKVAIVAITLLSLGCLGAFEVPALNLDANVKFSTQHVKRGFDQGKKVFAPAIRVSLPVLEKGKVYAGAGAIIGIESERNEVLIPTLRNEVNPYVGASYDITEIFTVDAGYIHHFYTNMPKEILSTPQPGGNIPSPFKRNTSEMYVGVLADVLLSPSLYFFYDFGSKEVNIEGCVNYTYDLGQFGVSGLALELGAKLGYDRAKRPFACNKATVESIFSGRKGYFYYGLASDAVYSFTEHAKGRVGVELAGNHAKREANSWAGTGAKHSLWFNASVDCSF
ncbi:MAG: hypothetical protein LBJ94_00140 [Puniceicoccales bacterium]|nr:hypothetical protein [Puniceicoccales bacterium]